MKKNIKFNTNTFFISMIILVLVILTIILSVGFSGSEQKNISGEALYNVGQYEVINDHTALKKDDNAISDTDTIDILLSKKQVVKVIAQDPSKTYKYKVEVNGEIGYLRSFDIAYISSTDYTYSVMNAKATSPKLGEKIKLYSAADTTSDVKFEVRDGQKLNVIDEEIEGYYAVVYKNTRLFVERANVTTKLSHSQLTALIISIVSAVTVLVLFSLIYLSKNIKDKKSHNEFMRRM